MGDNYNKVLEEVFKKQSFDFTAEEQKEHLIRSLKVKEPTITIIPTNNYKPYIISDIDMRYSRAVALTEEQAKAINWFIDNFGLDDFSCVDIDEESCERIE